MGGCALNEDNNIITGMGKGGIVTSSKDQMIFDLP